MRKLYQFSIRITDTVCRIYEQFKFAHYFNFPFYECAPNT